MNNLFSSKIETIKKQKVKQTKQKENIKKNYEAEIQKEQKILTKAEHNIQKMVKENSEFRKYIEKLMTNKRYCCLFDMFHGSETCNWETFPTKWTLLLKNDFTIGIFKSTGSEKKLYHVPKKVKTKIKQILKKLQSNTKATDFFLDKFGI